MNKKICSGVGVLLAVTLLVATAQAKPNKWITEEAMSRVKEAGTPKTEHEILESFIGKWKVTTQLRIKSDGKPHTSSGTSSTGWTLDGRFLQEKFKGNWFGEPVEGLGFVGYDKIKKAYVSVWMDNLSTNIFQATGQYDAKTKTIKDKGKYSYPATGETDVPFRAEWQLVDHNTHTYSMFVKDRHGKEFKSIELIYRRVK